MPWRIVEGIGRTRDDAANPQRRDRLDDMRELAVELLRQDDARIASIDVLPAAFLASK